MDKSVFLGEDVKLFDSFSFHKISFISGELKSIFIGEGKIKVEISDSIKRTVILEFSNIKEYSFYYNSQYWFYNIETFKFFSSNGFFYLSLDPYDEEQYINEKDQDFILAEKVTGHLLVG